VSPSGLNLSGARIVPLKDNAQISQVRPLCRARPWLDPSTKQWITVHGWRSVFRTFCQTSRWDREVVEIAMGHRFHGAVESRYARSDLLAERRELLDAWARYLDTPVAGAEIIPLLRA
jgi:hypothetical protein